MPSYRKILSSTVRLSVFKTSFEGLDRAVVTLSPESLSPVSYFPCHHVRKYHQLKHNNSNHSGKGSGERDENGFWEKAGGAFVGVGAFLGLLAWKKYYNEPKVYLDAKNVSSSGNYAKGRHEEALKNLPYYSRNDVAEHYDSSRKIWVSFRRGVYDVTEFIDVHPGGSKILMAAGGSLEPFWELYPVHQNAHVFTILEKYRIGNLREEDVLKAHEAVDHFQGEPSRHPALIRRSQKPFNGETPPAILTEQFYTPNDLFYVRNHLPVPEINAKTYRLEVDGINLRDKALSLDELKKFPKVTVSATIQCGGNRRTEMGGAKPVAGLGWTGGAIGNAKWTGARLVDVLRSANFNPESYKNPERLHVKFDGLDMDQSGECYGASIPLSYILDGNFDAVLAYEMNDKPLPIDHGFPVRIILPGIVGARSVKWLSRISISEEESQSPWQQRDYKVFSPAVTLETVDFSAAPPITDTPVTSYICSHGNEEKVKKGVQKLQGYAFSGGGRRIVRVEVSSNQGKTWEVARISKEESSLNRTKNWSWVLWEAEVDLKKDTEIWVKAVDNGYNQQPEDFKNIWNYRGLMSTAYHKINLKVG